MRNRWHDTMERGYLVPVGQRAEGLSQCPTTPLIEFARVIADLRPTTTLVHRKTAACSLPERMAHYATPAVSIAVVDGGRVA